MPDEIPYTPFDSFREQLDTLLLSLLCHACTDEMSKAQAALILGLLLGVVAGALAGMWFERKRLVQFLQETVDRLAEERAARREAEKSRENAEG